MKRASPAPAVKSKARILIVEDHPVMREGLMLRINQERDLTVCAEASNSREAMAQIAQQQPDLVVLDLSLGESHGLEIIKDIRVRYPRLPVVVFSMHDETLYAERALHAGAQGYVMKRASSSTLLEAIRRVLAGEVFLSPEMTRKFLDGLPGHNTKEKALSPAEKLSDREFEIFEMIGQGYGTMEIAQRLRVSPKTISSHRENIKVKLGFANSADLLRHAIHIHRQQEE